MDFRRYKVTDSAAVREFYLLLRAAVKGAKGIGRLGLLINDQTIPRIMSKMPYTDWKEWATKRPDWMQQDVATTFERFVERKWQDALNVAAAKPACWSVGRGRYSPNGGTMDRTAPTSKGMLKVTGAVNVVEQKTPSRSHSPSWDVSFGRKRRARNLIGCDGDHVLLQCDKLLSMELSERKEILEKSGLCLFCLKHAVELECYGRGGLSKPRCTQAGCDGEYTPNVHKLMGEENAGVNLVAEDESELEEDEDEEWWVGTVGVMEAQDEEEGSTGRNKRAGARKGNPIHRQHLYQKRRFRIGERIRIPLGHPLPKGAREDGWWSPEPLQPTSGEDGEEVQCFVQVVGPQPLKAEPVLGSVAAGSREGVITPGRPRKEKPPCPRNAKRKRLRKKMERTRDQEWEQARQDAWLRGMLSDTPSSEDEESCRRVAESGRWASELFKIPQHPATTSGGECAGQFLRSS